MQDFQAARRAMVDGQIRTNDVTDLDLIEAMLEIPREAFVPADMAPLAYLDRDLAVTIEAPGAIGAPGATRVSRILMKPMTLARLIQAADPAPEDNVLVVGCGTGYAPAVLSRIAGPVVGLEDSEAFVTRGRSAISRIDIHNVTLVAGNLVEGWPGAAPYDVILIDGGVEFIPPALFGQLAPRGRLVAVVTSGVTGKAMCYESFDGEVSGRAVCDSVIPALPGFQKAPAFVF